LFGVELPLFTTAAILVFSSICIRRAVCCFTLNYTSTVYWIILSLLHTILYTSLLYYTWAISTALYILSFYIFVTLRAISVYLCCISRCETRTSKVWNSLYMQSFLIKRKISHFPFHRITFNLIYYRGLQIDVLGAKISSKNKNKIIIIEINKRIIETTVAESVVGCIENKSLGDRTTFGLSTWKIDLRD